MISKMTNEKVKELIDQMDILACESLTPDLMDKWRLLVCYWDKFPQFKGVKKEHHDIQKNQK